jgi:hypothetical protein
MTQITYKPVVKAAGGIGQAQLCTSQEKLEVEA